MSYQDKWTRWHDKTTDGVNPSSNNGWIYTAYAKYLAPGTVDKHETLKCYRDCRRNLDPVKIDRSPNKIEPPLSKDEVVGMASLGLLAANELKNSYWNFCNLPEYTQKPLSLKTIIIALIALFKIRKEHRNYVWQNKMTEAYPLAFRLPMRDIYHIKRIYGHKTNIFETTGFFLSSLLLVIRGDKSSRMMMWLQMMDLHPNIARLLPKHKYVTTYFGKNHPFTKGL